MDDGGYIIVQRSFLQSDLWTREPFTRGQAWIDLLARARFKDGHDRINGVRVDLKRGQLIGCHIFLKNRWGWKSRKKVAKFLKELSEDQLITLGKDQPNQYASSIITITCYDSIQLNGSPEASTDTASEAQPRDSQGTAKGQPRDSEGTHLKTENNGKNGNIKYPETLDECLPLVAGIGMDPDDIQRCFSHYVSVGWVKGQAKLPIKDVRQAFQSWKMNGQIDRAGSSPDQGQKKEPPASDLCRPNEPEAF